MYLDMQTLDLQDMIQQQHADITTSYERETRFYDNQSYHELSDLEVTGLNLHAEYELHELITNRNWSK